MRVPEQDVQRRLVVRTFEDRASLAGAAGASLALTWVLYEQVFAFSGGVGFVVSWYSLFVASYALLTALSNPRTVVVDRVIASVICGGAGLVGLVLLSTVGYIFVKAVPALSHMNFFTRDMRGVRPTSSLGSGGVKHAIAGTVIQVGIAVAVAYPLGTGTAIFMSEVGGRFANVVRTVVEAMTALPDIVAGLFVYAILIKILGWDKSGLAVAFALVVTMVPVTARSAEVVLKVVAGSLREAGLALGASKWKTVRHVVLPTARPGLATALILGIARIAGETAPLIIVSGASPYFNANPLRQSMNSLPLFIYDSVRSGQPAYIQRGYGAAALLLGLVLALFTVTRLLARNRGAR
jgi:phosphate transport system permease protein